MDKYINDETIVKNEIYLVFQDLLNCPICSNILIDPYMCMNCQNFYCKKCIDEWSKKDNKCPNRCENPNYKKSIEKNNILSKLKFKCKNCGKEILYEDVEKHVDSCEPGKKEEIKEEKINNIIEEKIDNIIEEKIDNTIDEKNINIITNNERMKRLTPREAEKIKKKGTEPMKMTCKKYIINIFIN